MLELGARNNWLMDAQVSTRERVTRAVAEALHSTQEDSRAIKKFGIPDKSIAAEQWVDLAKSWADSLGLEARKDKRGRVNLVEYKRPTSSEMVQDFVDAVGGQKGAALYAYFSAATHGQVYHLAQLGGESVDIPKRPLSEVAAQVQLAVQITKVVHVRYALYLGKESASRIRPYEKVFAFLGQDAGNSLQVGQL